MSSKRLSRVFIVVFGCAALLSCEWDFERMRFQPSFDTYEPSPFFENGTIMRQPPPGVVHRGELLGPESLLQGTENGVPIQQIPLPLTSRLVARGQNRFAIFCAPCHGVLGDGESVVAYDMKRRPPPSLISPPVSEYPPGRIYRVISLGYGLMRSYDAELDVPDRWAVTAYLRALQLSQGVKLSDLPLRMRAKAIRSLPEPKSNARQDREEPR